MRASVKRETCEPLRNRQPSGLAMAATWRPGMPRAWPWAGGPPSSSRSAAHPANNPSTPTDLFWKGIIMLVIARPRGKSVFLEAIDDIPAGTVLGTITIHQLEDRMVRLLIDAPASVLVMRDEAMG